MKSVVWCGVGSMGGWMWIDEMGGFSSFEVVVWIEREHSPFIVAMVWSFTQTFWKFV